MSIDTAATGDARVAFVTGAAQGIGAAIARRLASEGLTVVIGDLDAERAAATADAIAADTARPCHATAIDVTSPASVRDAAAATVDRHGRVDVLVNNAGISYDSSTLDHADTDWHRMIAVNLTGAFYGCREFARHMRARGGAVVNISSIAALLAGRPERHVAYDVSKAGIIALTRTLGVEWAPLGIRVNAVAPGYTNTEILSAVGSTNPAVLEEWLSQVPQRRLIDPDDIARVVAFLASDASAAITGQLVVADGGYTAAA